MQRYLTGKSIGQSRLSLLFNAMAKVPMQFMILFIGAMVFVFFLFDKPPLLFHPVELARVEKTPEFPAIESRYNDAFDHRRAAALEYKDAQNDTSRATAADKFRAAQKDLDGARADALKLATENDTNYIFLTFQRNALSARRNRRFEC